MKFDLQELSCLIAIASERSFTHAAAKMHVTQPALSRKVRELEKRLGVTLIERTTRRVCLTKAGQTLSNYAQLILDTCAEAEEAMIRFRVTDRQAVELGYGSRAQFEYMLRLISSLHDVAPQQRINVSHARTFERLYLGQLDAALLMEGTVAHQKGIQYQHLDHCGLSAFFPRGYYPGEKGAISMAELQDRQIIFTEPIASELGVPFLCLHEMIRGKLLEYGISEENFHVSTSPEDFCSKIISEQLIGIMPDSSAAVVGNLIEALPISECRDGFGIVLAWNEADAEQPWLQMLKKAAVLIQNLV